MYVWRYLPAVVVADSAVAWTVVVVGNVVVVSATVVVSTDTHITASVTVENARIKILFNSTLH